MLPRSDLAVEKAVSVANLPCRRFMVKYLSARYLRLIGKMADRTPLWTVTRNVFLARSGPMQNRSAKESAVTCVCLRDTNVRGTGTSVSV